MSDLRAVESTPRPLGDDASKTVLVETSSGLVSVADARRATPVVREPDALALAEVKNAHEQATAVNERGIVGRLLGTKTEKPGNIAFIVILVCFALVTVAFFRFDLEKSFDNFMKLAAVLFSIISGAHGYLFGSSQKS